MPFKSGKDWNGNRKGKPKGSYSTLHIPTAKEILSRVDEIALWEGLVNSKNEKIRIQALQYLSDKRDGKAISNVDIRDDRKHVRIDRADANTARLGEANTTPESVPPGDRVQ